MANIAVVHLVRKANGLAAFQTFVESYRQHEAGVGHDLLLLMKGFTGAAEVQDYERQLECLPNTKLFVPDTGYDLGSYFLALQRTNYDCYCFLNSFSVIQAPHWLSMLESCLNRERVGLVGATGSYESTYENLRQEIRAIPGIFRRRRLRALLRLPRTWLNYPPFPNPSIRTNGFMARRSVLMELRPRRMRTKCDALRFESGRHSLTRRVAAMGLDTLVVGRDGRGYRPEEWPVSNTFRQRDQENLLIADNQTLRYSRAAADERRLLRRMAWSEKALADVVFRFGPSAA